MQLLYRMQIKLLLVFSPATLFRKLSQLSWYSDALHEWVDLHTDNRNLRVLDVGCASGYLTEYVSQMGHTVSGVDASKSMIKAAKHRMPRIDFKVGDACHLPYATGCFDLVLSASLINIISEPSALVAQMTRVCKAGGWVTFLFPISGFDDEDLYKCILSLGIAGFSEAALVTWHKSAPKIPAEQAIELLRRNDLRVSEPTYYLNGMIASVSARKDIVV